MTMRRASMALLLAALMALPSTTATASSVSARRSGRLVLYLLFKELGYGTSRIMKVPPAGEPSGLDLIVALDEDDSRRVEQLASWVAPGRRLLFAPPAVQGASFCGAFRFGEHKIERVVSKPPLRAKDPKLKFESSYCQMKPPPGAKVLVGACGSAAAIELSVGDGKVLLLAHGSMLDNATIDDDDMIVVVRRWLEQTAPPPAQAAFLEKHAGQLWEMLRKANMLPLVLHGLLWLLLLYWVVTPRFGESAPLAPSNRREFAEHAKALGRLYLTGHASAHVLRRQYERFVSRLFGTSGTDGSRRRRPIAAKGDAAERQTTGRDRTALAALVATRTGRNAKQIELLLARIEESAATADTRATQEHYRLSQALAELQHSSTPGGKRKKGQL